LTSISPAQKGFDEAIHRLNKNPDDIYVLSLSTGLNSRDILGEDTAQTKGLLNWAVKIPQFVMMGQTHDADIFLRSKLNQRYKRFQVYFEDDIPMDAHVFVPDLIEIATQYIEEQHDQINSVIENLLDD
jgi:hypothetical protein